MIERNRHPAGRLFNILFGLCEIADGLIRVASLGYLHSRLTLTLSRRATEKHIARQKELRALLDELQDECEGLRKNLVNSGDNSF